MTGLKVLMDLRGVTVRGLANELGVSFRAVQNWRANPLVIGRDNREKLCKYFKCNSCDLENFSLED